MPKRRAKAKTKKRPTPSESKPPAKQRIPRQPKIMEPEDYDQFTRLMGARDILQRQLELANRGYISFSDDLKRKYKVPLARQMTVHFETHEITSSVKES